MSDELSRKKNRKNILFKRKIQLISIFSWLAVFLWMIVIFNLSSQEAEQSNTLSSGITEVIVKTVEDITQGYKIDIVIANRILRKNTHLFAYIVLGVLVLNSLKRSGAKGMSLLALSISICMLYAATDELHQLFVPGRSGQISDVFLDGFGVIIGIGMELFLERNFHKS